MICLEIWFPSKFLSHIKNDSFLIVSCRNTDWSTRLLFIASRLLSAGRPAEISSCHSGSELLDWPWRWSHWKWSPWISLSFYTDKTDYMMQDLVLMRCKIVIKQVWYTTKLLSRRPYLCIITSSSGSMDRAPLIRSGIDSLFGMQLFSNQVVFKYGPFILMHVEIQ